MQSSFVSSVAELKHEKNEKNTTLTTARSVCDGRITPADIYHMNVYQQADWRAEA